MQGPLQVSVSYTFLDEQQHKNVCLKPSENLSRFKATSLSSEKSKIKSENSTTDRPDDRSINVCESERVRGSGGYHYTTTTYNNNNTIANVVQCTYCQRVNNYYTTVIERDRGSYVMSDVRSFDYKSINRASDQKLVMNAPT